MWWCHGSQEQSLLREGTGRGTHPIDDEDPTDIKPQLQEASCDGHGVKVAEAPVGRREIGLGVDGRDTVGQRAAWKAGGMEGRGGMGDERCGEKRSVAGESVRGGGA